MATDNCWVKFFDGEDMDGATFTSYGPINVPDFDVYKFSNGNKGGDEPDSLIMGPMAWLQVYTDKNYGGDTAYFYPGDGIEELDEYGVGGDIESYRLYDSRPGGFPARAGTRALQGTVQSGEDGPGLAGLHVTLFEASAEAPKVRGQATTDSNGWFVIDSDVSLASGIFYVTASRSDGIALAAVLGPDLPAQIRINERTTVAAAFSMARFAATGAIQGPPFSLRIAAQMNDNLVAVGTGKASQVLLTPPNARQTNSLHSTNSLANLILACVRQVPDALRNLLTLTTPPQSTSVPGNTFQALINIARYPTNNIAGIYTLSQSEGIYGPALQNEPDAWTLAVKFNHTGSLERMFGGPANVAFDQRGYGWITNNVVQGTPNSGDFAVVLKPNGKPADGMDGTPTSPLLGGGIYGGGFGVMVGADQHCWLSNFGWGEATYWPSAGGVSLFDPAGNAQSPSSTGGYVGAPQASARVQAIVEDQDHNVWLASYGNGQVVVFLKGDPKKSIAAPSPPDEAPFGIAIADDGSAWVTSSKGLYEYKTGSISRYRISQDESTLECLFSQPLGRAVKGLSIDDCGNIWVPSGGENLIYVLDRDGGQIGAFGGGGINGPWATAVDGDGHVWVANFGQMLPHADYTNAGVSQLAGARADTRPPNCAMGDPMSPLCGYTLPSGGDPVRLANGQLLYGKEDPGLDPCYSPLMRMTSVQIDQAGNVWAVNNWKPNFKNSASEENGNPGGDGVVIFVGLAEPPKLKV